MEDLLKDLDKLGYGLVYYEQLESWKVVDYIAGINDYLTSDFVKVVFSHGFIFSVGTTLEGDGLVVELKKL